MRVLTRARFFFLGIAVVLLLLHAVGWLQGIEGLLAKALRPLQQPLAHVLPWSRPRTVSPESRDNVLALENQITRLTLENTRLKEALAERTAFKDQQAFLEQRKLHGVEATVIGQSAEGDEPIVVVNAGSEKGVKPGQAVVVADGILAGTVEKAEQGRSTVLLLTSTRIQVGAEVENTTRSQGIVSGAHGLTFLMKFIPQGESVEKGQTVLTSAVDERIPAHLPIGAISDVRFQPGDLFQEATVQPFVDIQRLQYVTIVTQR